MGGQSLTAASTSAGAVTWYADSNCAALAPGGTFTIAAGQSSVDLFYKDMVAGAPSISVTNPAMLANPTAQVHSVVAPALTSSPPTAKDPAGSPAQVSDMGPGN